MSPMASQITGFTNVYSAVGLGPDQRKYQSSTSLPFVRGIHRWPVNSPQKGPVTRKMFSFDDVLMTRNSYDDADIPTNEDIMMRSFGDFFDAVSNNMLNKQSNCRWFESPWRPCDVTLITKPKWMRSRLNLHFSPELVCMAILFTFLTICAESTG